ncbi:pectinesterase family protein [Paenibacillus ferrarius]|uniref:pectinesterase family protein n=1 Tax=Paenibacillus ferrarius TaxID=1469647 RepID=UPI003D2D46F4
MIYDRSFPVNEDFTGYSAGSLPSGYWTVQSGSSYLEGAVKVASAGNQEPNSLYFDDEGAGYASAYRTFTAQTGVVTASAYFKLPAPPKLTNGVPNGTYATLVTGSHNLFQLLGSDGKIAVSLATQNNGSLAYAFKGSTGGTIIPTVPFDTWFQLKAVVDYPNKWVDVYYNGTKVLSSQSFYDTSSVPKDIGTFKSITPNNNTSVAAQAYIDNLSITAPVVADQGYGINLSSLTNAKSITVKGGSLSFSASKTSGSTASPTWAVYNYDLTPTTAATIDASGVLTARGNGNVVVAVSMNDGTATQGLFPVAITGQESFADFKPVAISTAVGTVPVLPAAVSVIRDDGSITPAAVIWDLVPPSRYNQEGTVTIQGTVSGYAQRPSAQIQVVPTAAIGYKPVIVTTTAGIAPGLPSSVGVQLNNNTTQSLPVVWSPVAPALYAQTNVKGFAVSGTVQGQALPVIAHVSVLPDLASGVKPILVAADGSGDYASIQEAVNAVPDQNQQRAIIYIKNGVYYEKVLIPESKPYISLIGESQAGTILTYDDNPKKTMPDGTSLGLGTYTDYTLMIKGHDFNAKTMTIANSSGSGAGQSVAVDVYADKAYFESCNILGYQDTLLTRNLTDNADPSNYANNNTLQTYRSYYKDCYIAGSVDFIFGPGIAVFDQSEIHSRLAGHVTAASTPAGQKYGYVFLNSTLSGEALLEVAQTDTGPVDLGRPWRPYAKTVYLNTYMGKHIAKVGWNNFGKTSNEATAYYGEYQSTGPGANPASRLAWTRQLTSTEAQKYTLQQIFSASSLIGGTDDWNPLDASPVAAIASLPAVQVTTPVGTAPELPSVIDAVYTDGGVRSVPVVWAPVVPAQYAQGGSFSVAGSVPGTTIPATAVVTVRAGSILTGPQSVTAGQPLVLSYGWSGVAEQVYGLDLTVNYPSAQLQYVSANSLVNGISVIDQSTAPGQVRVVLASSTPGVSLTGNLADIVQLHFIAADEAQGTAAVSLSSAVIADGNGHETTVDGTSYSVLIKASEVTADTSALSAKLQEAQSKLADASVGDKWGQYTQSALNALSTATASASSVLNQTHASQTVVDQAVISLTQAIQVFTASVNTTASVGDLGILASHYGLTSVRSAWASVKRYDFNHDNQLDIVDLSALAQKIIGN